MFFCFFFFFALSLKCYIVMQIVLSKLYIYFYQSSFIHLYTICSFPTCFYLNICIGNLYRDLFQLLLYAARLEIYAGFFLTILSLPLKKYIQIFFCKDLSSLDLLIWMVLILVYLNRVVCLNKKNLNYLYKSLWNVCGFIVYL